jgi:hypothetical protein
MTRPASHFDTRPATAQPALCAQLARTLRFNSLKQHWSPAEAWSPSHPCHGVQGCLFRTPTPPLFESRNLYLPMSPWLRIFLKSKNRGSGQFLAGWFFNFMPCSQFFLKIQLQKTGVSKGYAPRREGVNRTRVEKVAVLEVQLDGPRLEAGPGSLSEMHLTRVVSLESLLQILHLRSVPPGLIPTACCMAWWQSGHISKSAKKLQPSQARDVSITTPCRTPVLLQFRCQSTN